MHRNKCEQLEDLLQLYALGEATAEERRQVEGHIAACPQCRELLGNLRRVDANIARWPDLPQPMAPLMPKIDAGVNEGIRKRFFWPSWLDGRVVNAAGTLSAVVVVALVLVGLSSLLSQMQQGVNGVAQQSAWEQARAVIPADVAVYQPGFIPEGFGEPTLVEALRIAGHSDILYLNEARDESDELTVSEGPVEARDEPTMRERPADEPVGPRYTIRYEGTDENITFVLGVEAGPLGSVPPPENIEPIEVNGVQGQLLSSDVTSSLIVTWEEQGRPYQIKAYSSRLTKDDMRRIADSLTPVAVTPAPQPTVLPIQPQFDRDEAITQAYADAKSSSPGVDVMEARVDSVDAALMTLGDADKRMGNLRGPAGYGADRGVNTPVWWVSAKGNFLYTARETGLVLNAQSGEAVTSFRHSGVPEDGLYRICETSERVLVYDAQTGEMLSSHIPMPVQLAANDAWGQALLGLPSATPVYKPTFIPEGFGPPSLIEARTDGPHGPRYTIVYEGTEENIAFVLGVGAGSWGNRPEPTNTEPIKFKGVQGELLSSEKNHFLGVAWREKDRNYQIKVFSKRLTKEDIVRIADSLTVVTEAALPQSNDRPDPAPVEGPDAAQAVQPASVTLCNEGEVERFEPGDPGFAQLTILASKLISSVQPGDAIEITNPAIGADRILKEQVALEVTFTDPVQVADHGKFTSLLLPIRGPELSSLGTVYLGNRDNNGSEHYARQAPLQSAVGLEMLSPGQNIFVLAPNAGTTVRSPFTIVGIARLFEAAGNYELLDVDGNILAEGAFTTDAGAPEFGRFVPEVSYNIVDNQPGTLRVFSHSAATGEPDNIVSIPLNLIGSQGSSTGPEPVKPDSITLYYQGKVETFEPGGPGFEPLAEVTRRLLNSARPGTELALANPWDEADRIKKEQTALEIAFAEPVQVIEYAQYQYTTLLLPLPTAESSVDRVLYLGNERYTVAVSLEARGAVLDVRKILGLPMVSDSVPATPTPVAFTEQYEITEKDNGRTFVYPVNTRFTLVLDQKRYPRENMQTSCQPGPTVGLTSKPLDGQAPTFAVQTVIDMVWDDVPDVQPPLYALRYEAMKRGACKLMGGDFQVTIQVVE